MTIFKKTISAVSACLMIFSIVSATAFAGEIYTFTEKEIDSAPVRPVITIDSKILSMEEVKEYDNKTEISVKVKGADMKYASTGLHICYDNRLTIAENKYGYPDIEKGNAIKYLNMALSDENPSSSEYGMKEIFLATSGNNCYGMNGTMWTINFILPDDVQEGDIFPIDIVYKENSETADMFSNVTNNRDGQLMSAYTFTKGIFNGIENNFRADVNDIEKCPSLADISADADGYIAIESTFETTTITTKTTESDIIYGDANKDGNVNMSDATAIIQHIGNRDAYGLDDAGIRNSDVNGDNQVTGEDAIIIQRAVAGEFKLSDLPLKS